MTDLYSDASLGEDVYGNAETETVEYNATITAGQGLNIESINSSGQAVVGVAGAGERARFVAMFDGVDGDYKKALKKGLVKVTYGGAVAGGADIPVKPGAAGVFVTAATTGADAHAICGYAIKTGTTSDTGLIWFNGEK